MFSSKRMMSLSFSLWRSEWQIYSGQLHMQTNGKVMITSIFSLAKDVKRTTTNTSWCVLVMLTQWRQAGSDFFFCTRCGMFNIVPITSNVVLDKSKRRESINVLLCPIGSSQQEKKKERKNEERVMVQWSRSSTKRNDLGQLTEKNVRSRWWWRRRRRR